jgi:type III restriction enzyme
MAPTLKKYQDDALAAPDAFLAAAWLPTSTDRFYPDFVAELTDGRLFALEYKGGDRYSNDDSKEKRGIGAVWAAASQRRCVFLMATDAATAGVSVMAQLRQAIDG